MDAKLRHPSELFSAPVRYEIPAFQRQYVWTQEDQWEPLWDDIEQLARVFLQDEKPEPHFMGAVVIQQEPALTGSIPRRTVVDGQQRLTTFQILIHAIKDVFDDREHTDPAQRLATLVENGKVFLDGDPDNAFKVWPTIKDRDAFRYAMRGNSSATDYEESLIIQAHRYFATQTENWLDELSEETRGADQAARDLEHAVKHLGFVVIDLGEADDPHVIFETLNARGTPLLQSDMIKNKILYHARSGEKDDLWPFKDDWWNEYDGRGVQRRKRVDLYLNHWLTLRNRSEIKAHDEFRVFDKYTKSQGEPEEEIYGVARDMTQVGRVFRDIEQKRRTDIAKFLERRSTMNVGAVTPLLLYLLSSDVPEKTVANCLKALESFLVRRVICGLGSKSYGKFFVGLISKLAGEPANADRILLRSLAEQTSQGTLCPSDKELRERFVAAPLYRWLTRGRLSMVLTGIEEHLRTERAETQEAPQNLQIEHIMPQRWNDDNWPLPSKGVEAAVRRANAIHTIGNLTLVNKYLNPSLSNAAWDRKRGELAKYSTLFLNKHLVNEWSSIWDEDVIEERAEWLCEKAVKVWPHPGSGA